MNPIIAKLAVIFLGILGFLLALWIYHKKKRNEQMVCPFRGECGQVIFSRYSQFFGIELTHLGMMYYGFIVFAYTVMLLFHKLVVPEVVFVMLGISMVGFLFSLYLTGVQAFLLKRWCTWCLCSMALCTFIFIVTVVGIEFSVVKLFADYKGLIVLFHSIAAAIGVGAVTITDVFFFRFLKDYRISQDEADIMRILSDIIWFTLGLLVLTSIGLFVPATAVILIKTKFIMEIIITLVLIINGVVLNLVVHPRLVDISFGEESVDHTDELHHLRKLAYALGGVSLVSWYGVFILGSLSVIPLSFGALIALYAVLIIIAIAASQYFDYLVTNKKISPTALS